MPDTKKCSRCHRTLSLSEYYIRKKTGLPLPQCKRCSSEQQKIYIRSAKGKLANKKKHLKEFYNLSIEEHEQLYINQNGLCGLCQESIPYNEMVVDHNHFTEKIRNLLCGRCNRLLGYIEKTPETAKACFAYLERMG